MSLIPCVTEIEKISLEQNSDTELKILPPPIFNEIDVSGDSPQN